MAGQAVRWGILSTANIARAAFLPGMRAAGGVAEAVASRTAESAQRYADAHGIARALEGWREQSAAAFLSGYRQALGGTLWPQDPGDADRLLDFFLLEKAFYEIEYELAHRPDWLRVPLAGTCRILTRSEAKPE